MAMLAAGYFGTLMISGGRSANAMFVTEAFSATSNYNLTVIPLFILMGNIASVAGFSSRLYEAAFAWVGWLRGGLASASILGCAAFAAVSGSSVATAVTIGKVALPEMKRFGYSDALATGAIAAGGHARLSHSAIHRLRALCHPDRGKQSASFSWRASCPVCC